MNYDDVAAGYARRYALHDYADTLRFLTTRIAGRGRVLEVGCGQGTWVDRLGEAGADMRGVDPSREMLRRAPSSVRTRIVQAVGERLPFGDGVFDATVFINSFHHMRAADLACREAHRVLRPGGVFVSIGLDPHAGVDRWFVYDFFPETRALDRDRYPSTERRTRLLRQAGFTNVRVEVAERLRSVHAAHAARANGLLERSFTSQLTLVTDSAYAAGVARFDAFAADERAVVEADLTLFATTAIA